MEVRMIAETVLRCQSASLPSLRRPASTVRWSTHKQLASPRISTPSQKRSFVTTLPKYSFKPDTTTTDPSARPENKSKDDIQQQSSRANVDEVAHSLGWIRNTGGSRIDQSKIFRERELAMNDGSSADDILKSLSSVFPRSTSPSTGRIDLSQMKNPSTQTSPESATDMMSAIATLLPKQEKIRLRLSPSTGRSISVQGNIDVAKAFRTMERTCGQNGIRRSANLQRFHERPATKQKRLRRARWRARFLEGFKDTVAKVKRLRKQGW